MENNKQSLDEEKIVMISQPMKGLSDEEIEKTRTRAVKCLTEKGYKVIDTFFNLDNPAKYDEETTKFKTLAYLSESIKAMSTVDAVYFVKGWEDARGCKIEHMIAEQYGLELLHEGDCDNNIIFLYIIEQLEETLGGEDAASDLVTRFEILYHEKGYMQRNRYTDLFGQILTIYDYQSKDNIRLKLASNMAQEIAKNNDIIYFLTDPSNNPALMMIYTVIVNLGLQDKIRHFDSDK